MLLLVLLPILGKILNHAISIILKPCRFEILLAAFFLLWIFGGI